MTPDSAAPHDIDRDIDRVVELLESAASVLFITGAGLSADSGLPTYRGVAGLYNADTPDGMPIEEILSPDTLQSRPDLAWKYLAEIGRAAAGGRPNRGHEVIAEMEGRFARVCVLTQNVDDYHNQAGSHNVLEIHGNMRRLVCTSCRRLIILGAMDDLDIPPRCEACGALMRPGVVLFGEMLPHEVLENFYGQWEEGFDLIFSVGTTSIFPYIAAPIEWARRRGIPTVEINPGRSEVSDLVTVRLPSGAARSLDEIWRRYLHKTNATT